MSLIRHGLGFRWTDEENAVELHYDRLRRDREGLVHAAVIAVSSLNGHSGALCETSHVNLESPASRSAFLKAVATSTPGTGIEWASIFSAANQAIVAAYLEGGLEAVLLRDVEAPDGGEEAMPPLIKTRRPTNFFGAPGAAKSQLVLDIATAIHTGRDFAGMKPRIRVPMLIIDSEDDPYPWKQRLIRRWPIGEVLPDLHYVRVSGSLRQNVERLQRIKADLNIGGGVYDSGGALCGGPPEDSDRALDFHNAIRELDLRVNLVTCHVNRTGDTSQPFGSQYWNAASGSTWYVSKEQEVGSDTLTVTLVNRKPAQNGRLERPLAFRYTFGPDRTEVVRLDARNVESLSTSLSITDQIAKVVRFGAKSVDEIRLALPMVKKDVLDTTLARACKRGVLISAEQIDKGKRVRVYGLPAHQAPDAESPNLRQTRDLLDDPLDLAELASEGAQ
jgi:AAA domain